MYFVKYYFGILTCNAYKFVLVLASSFCTSVNCFCAESLSDSLSSTPAYIPHKLN